jgi:hypothetical protein
MFLRLWRVERVSVMLVECADTTFIGDFRYGRWDGHNKADREFD